MSAFPIIMSWTVKTYAVSCSGTFVADRLGVPRIGEEVIDVKVSDVLEVMAMKI